MEKLGLKITDRKGMLWLDSGKHDVQTEVTISTTNAL